MPDAALRSTERQFISVVNASAGGAAVRIHFFTLPGIPRGDEARSYLQTTYGLFSDLLRRAYDAVIVTGSEPHADGLDQEPYWGEMTRLIDWADTHTAGSLWSCLAAHAAVTRLSGIKRQRLPTKMSGVFDVASVGSDPLLAGIVGRATVPHSRWNTVAADDLRAAGYDILRETVEGDADLFTLTRRSRCVFLQGHPEYEPETLTREYRRDVGRFLKGETQIYPAEPVNYFDAEATKVLHAYRRRAEAHRDPALMAVFPNVTPPFATTDRWCNPARRLFRNWLGEIAAQKGFAALA